MENMILSYTNEKFGKVRLVVFERNILFCANDIARCLGFADPWSAVKNHCGDKVLHPHVSGNGTKVMNFITTSGVAALSMHSRSANKDDFIDWLVQQVIPSAISDTRIFFRKPEEADLYLPDDDEQFVIRFGDYFRHVSHEQELMSMVTEFIDAVSLLPDCKPMEDLKEWAETAEEYLEDLVEEKCPVLNSIIDDDIKGYAEMMKRELIEPKKAGYQKSWLAGIDLVTMSCLLNGYPWLFGSFDEK
jgi:prophage antirepressor-like protein